MTRATLLMMGGAVALLVGTSANAATTTGQVVTTDALTSALTIETDRGERLAFVTNTATTIEQSGVAVALDDLRKDSRVTVTSEQAPSDASAPMLASHVSVDQMAPVAAAPAAGSVPVESAGRNGGMPVHTAHVESAEAAPAESAPEESPVSPREERLPKTATPLPLIAVLGAAALASGVLLRLRRRNR